jgi:octaprenyl-diphosphate synthase
MTKSPIAAAFDELYKSIRPDLNRVETTLREVCRDSNPLISEINDYLFQVAGKRIRPALLLLTSRLFGRDPREAPFWAAMTEIVHTASLVHDDIVDNSGLRRGRATVHSKWGANITVLLGDFLYIRAIDRSLRTRALPLIDILSEATTAMIEGELLEFSWTGRPDIKESDYLAILDKKTAALFGGACRMGGLLGGASAEDERRLAGFGRNLGLCFQIIDDWLDFAGSERVLGKPVLSDVREGRFTLPLIQALARADKPDRRELLGLIKARASGARVARRILQLVKAAGGLDAAFARARSYAEAAHADVRGFPVSEAREVLDGLTGRLLERMA